MNYYLGFDLKILSYNIFLLRVVSKTGVFLPIKKLLLSFLFKTTHLTIHSYSV